MLVTFKTSSYADITMFGDAAESLLKMMGQSGNVPGAIMAADVPVALKALQDNLAVASEATAPPASAISDDDDAPAVAISTRALPLIELLESAIAAGDNVMWDQ